MKLLSSHNFMSYQDEWILFGLFFLPIIAYSACDSFLGRFLSLTLLNFRREHPIAVTFKFSTVSSSAGSYTECPLILRLPVIQAILHAQNVKVLKNVFSKRTFF